jgi:hypothetical protein
MQRTLQHIMTARSDLAALRTAGVALEAAERAECEGRMFLAQAMRRYAVAQLAGAA